MHGDNEPSRTSHTTNTGKKQMVSQIFGDIKPSRENEKELRSSVKRAESQKPGSKLSSSNIITWDNPYSGNLLLFRNQRFGGDEIQKARTQGRP